MTCKRNFFTFFTALFCVSFAVLSVLTGTAKGAEHTKRVEAFLKRTTLSASEQSDILEGVRAAPSRSQWLMAGGGQVYSLAVLPIQKEANPNLQIKLEEAARARASLRAHYLLYLRAVPPGRKARYGNEESVAEALSGWDAGLGAGKHLKPDLSAAIVSDGWAFAILRTQGELLERLSAQIENLPEAKLDTAYCAALYPKARALFDGGEYEKALPVYLELHSLKWARPVAYLDAAECFLHTGDKESAARLAEETAAELGGVMNSALLERAGDILLEAGREERAEHLYRLAIEKLRQES